MDRIRFLTAGESHGKALTVIVEGMVAGLPISEDYIAKQLARRQHGYDLIAHDGRRNPPIVRAKDTRQSLGGDQIHAQAAQPPCL